MRCGAFRERGADKSSADEVGVPAQQGSRGDDQAQLSERHAGPARP